MSESNIKNVAMIGAGTLGGQIAWRSADMGTLREIFSYWGTQSDDQDMLTNADYIKEHFLDTGRTGLLAGKGYYEYPNPTFQQPDFLGIPEMSAVPALAAKAKLN